MNSFSLIKFKDLPFCFRSLGNEYQDYIIQQFYSKFDFSFFQYNEDNRKYQSENEILFNQFLFKKITKSKFITYHFFSSSNKNYYSFSDHLYNTNVLDHKRSNTAFNTDNCIICIEKKCFIIESINKELMIQNLIDSKAALIDTSSYKNKDEIIANEEIKIFLHQTKISQNKIFQFENFFIQNTIYPIISFLVHRNFYPTHFFKDTGFFEFYDNSQSTENKIKHSINNFLNTNKKERSKFIENFQQFSKDVSNEINKRKQSNFQHLSIREFKETEFIKLRTIYSNNRSTYHLVIHIKSLYIFMMKKINMDVFIHEIEFCKFLSKNPNKNFVQFYGFIFNGDKIESIIYDYVCNGSLEKYIKNDHDELFLFNTTLRITQGIQYLQQNSFVHRDLKPNNILIDHDGKALISDLELVSHYDCEQGEKEVIAKNLFTIDAVSNSYGSPEQLLSDSFHISTDIYCFGEILYFLFEQKDLFYNINDVSIKCKDEIPEMTNGLVYIHKIYQSCVKCKYNERSSLNDIVNNLYNQIDSYYFINQYIINGNNKINVIQFFTEIFILISQFNIDKQLNKFINNHIFPFFFLNSSFEDNLSDLFFILGTFYYKGKYVMKDYSLTEKFFKLSANYGNSNALLALGDLYHFGEIVIQSDKIANEYYMKMSTKNTHLYFDYFFECINDIQIEYYNFVHYLIMNDEYHNEYSFALIEHLYSNVYGIKNDFFQDNQQVKFFDDSSFLYLGHLLHYGKMNDKDYFSSKYNDKINLEEFNIFEFIEKQDQYKFDEFNKEPDQISDILNAIGFLYLYGILFRQDRVKAEKYFRLSSKKNNENAFLNLGNLFTNDFDKSQNYFLKAIEINPSNSNAYCFLANLLYYQKKRDKSRIYQLIEKSALYGNIYSLSFYGIMYYKGEYCEPDLEKGRKNIEIAAFHNFSYSNNFLGNVYRTGRGVKQNYIKAKIYYELAAKKYHTASFNELGSFYNNGEGVDVDISRAIEYYLLVIKVNDYKNIDQLREFFKFEVSFKFKYDRNYYVACNNLAVISIIEPNYYNIVLAFRLFKKAGFSEFCFAKNNLGLFYQLYLNQNDRAENLFQDSSTKKFSLSFFNLGFLREIEEKIDESINYYIEASDNEETNLFLNNEPIFDHRLQISKTFIICLANLKVCLYYLKNSFIEKAKLFFVRAISLLENKYEKYKFVFRIDESRDYKFKFQFNDNNNFISLRSFIFDFPLFNLRNQKNVDPSLFKTEISIKQTHDISCVNFEKMKEHYNKISKEKEKNAYHSNMDNINLYDSQNHDCRIFTDPGFLFDFICMSNNLRIGFIREMELIVYIMNHILYTPPYQILFGRIRIGQKKPKINEEFYKGLDVFQY